MDQLHLPAMAFNHVMPTSTHSLQPPTSCVTIQGTECQSFPEHTALADSTGHWLTLFFLLRMLFSTLHQMGRSWKKSSSSIGQGPGPAPSSQEPQTLQPCPWAISFPMTMQGAQDQEGNLHPQSPATPRQLLTTEVSPEIACG